MRPLLQQLNHDLEQLKDQGLYKKERQITSAQSTAIGVDTVGDVLNFFANNYLGLSNNSSLIHELFIDWLRNRSRPYLFSNSLAPVIAAAILATFELLSGKKGEQSRQKL